MLKRLKNAFENTLEFINLKKRIRFLRKELEESKQKEKPYIDKINVLESQLRTYKIINGQLEKELSKKQS